MDCAAGSRRDTGLKPVGNRSEAGPMRISQPVPVPTNAGLDCRIGPRVRPEESTSTITHLRPPVVPVAVEIVITRTSRVDRENLPLRRLLQLQRRRKQLELRWLLLITQLGWAFDRSSLLLDASFVAHVPITESEYEAKRAEIAADLLTVNDAAELLLLLEEDDSKAAIRRAEKQVRTAIKAGELKAERQGRGYQMTYAAYCDWRGETVEPFPDWGRAYDVVPDDAVYFDESVERLRLATETGPHNPTIVLPALASESNRLLPEEKQSVHDRLLAGLAHHIAQGVPQQEMEVAALTEVVEAVAAEFRDEAIVAELNRAMLNDARARLTALRMNASAQVGEIDDAPYHEAMAEQIRRQIFDSEA